MLAASSDVNPRRLLDAYERGIFPWYSADQPVLWWSPDPRMVLFLDEFPEFPRNVLELLRQPLEERSVTIARSNMTLSFPANFMLIATANPCPHRYYGDPSGRIGTALLELLQENDAVDQLVRREGIQ